MDIQEKLLNLINDSSLDNDQKKDWESVVGVMDDMGARDMISLIDEKPDSLVFLTKNMQTKLKAFENPEKSELDDILKSEVEFVNSINE